MKRLTIFIMNAVQSPVFIAFCSRADKVVLRCFSSVHDPATESFKFPSVIWFLKRLGLDALHVFFKAGIFFMACNSVTKVQMTKQF